MAAPLSQSLWHAEAIDDVLRRFQTTPNGLGAAEAARRLAETGPNRLPRQQPVPLVRILVDQLASMVVILLGVAALVALALGDHIEAAAIGAVLAVNTAIGFTIDLRARRAMDALVQLTVPRATVVRDGIPRVVDSSAIVPGDVVELVAGQSVPADGRLISGDELRTAEAALTGESMPTSKRPAGTLERDTALPDRINMIYAGTIVEAGAGRAVVTATGAATELGRIGTLVASVAAEPTPLERRLDVLGRRLAWLALGIAAVIGCLEALHGARLGLVIETGIALAVAAVPEALPAVVTISLAVGLRRMARRHALVRHLPSVEALGSTTIICTDKTRTLTSGDMTVVRAWTPDSEFDLGGSEALQRERDRLRPLIDAAARASRRQAAHPDEAAHSSGRDPMDAAILRLAATLGIDASALASSREVAGFIPFSSTRRLMAIFEHVNGSTIAYVKGAPGRLVDLSGRALTAAGEEPLDDSWRARLRDVNRRLATGGLRVLGVARGTVARADESALRQLTFLGFLGFMDPPASGVKATIARLRDAGLRTVMLTGDQRPTAEAVGRELGLVSSSDQVLSGHDLTTHAGGVSGDRLARVAAVARVTPEEKLMIVGALQARGEIVAMLGDGVNDAAALKRADVGVAMGRRGTDVAKEAAAIVLQDDRFETIAAAVEEGRIIYDNIRKFVFYLFSCNLAEVLVLLLTGLANLPTPLVPLQILWINIVTDTFPALALAMEPGDRDVMLRPPRSPQEAILSRQFMGQVAFYGGLITASTLGAFLWGLAHAPEHSVTMSFMTLSLAQIFHLGNARSRQPVLAPLRVVANPHALAGAGVSLLLQVGVAQVAPFAALLHVTPLGLVEWCVVLALSSVTAVAGQSIRWMRLDRG
jgi:P-type Ca2+ transporter type 2C